MDIESRLSREPEGEDRLPHAIDAARIKTLKALAKKLGVAWRDDLAPSFHQALTHASYSKENPGTPDNERLELLGDAVATLVVLQTLFHEHPAEQEGPLSQRRHAMVSRKVFGQIGRNLELGKLLVVGEGARAGNIAANESVLGGALEALIGAMYLTLPWDEVRLTVVNVVVGPSSKIVASGAFTDFKTLLQHECHQRKWPEPAYRLAGEEGPKHAPVITVEVTLGPRGSFHATASRKRDAEQQAARQALAALKIADPGSAS